MSQHKIFETERLILIPTTEEDAEFIFELFNTPKWIKYVGDRNIKTVEDARDYIKTKMLSQLKRLGYSNYSLIRKSDDCKIGLCGLFDRDGVEGIEIGFAILPEYEKKGYAFESANKLKNVAFNEFGLAEINAITVKDNISSQKLLERLGLKLNGTTKLPDHDEELLLYKIKRQNWLQQQL
jgi:RimJ/RimL family protein N-acetyltransferase